MLLTLDNVKNFLSDKGFEAQFQRETNQVYFLMKIEGRDFPLFFRIFEEENLLQLVLFIPLVIKEGTEAEIARLLHAINKEIDIPGFCMDEAAGVIFYRWMLQCPDGKINETSLDIHLKTLLKLGEEFTPVIYTAASGTATFSEIMKKMDEMENESEL